jgi:2-dehydropantoate 2-reductase
LGEYLLKIAVMGAGSIGSLVGGLLAKAGNYVVLIARQPHVQAIERGGLIVEGVSGKHVLEVKAFTVVEHVKEKFDLILLTVKAYDTKEACLQAKSLMKDGTVFLCLQNGLGTEKVASEVVGVHNVLRGVTGNGALLKEPGIVEHTGKGETIIGEITGEKTRRAQTIAEIFTEANLSARVTDNITGAVWMKILVNAGINPLGALTGLRNGELLTVPELKEAVAETVAEGAKVVKKLGVKLESDDPVALTFKTIELTAQNKNSMLQDIERRKRTEIEYINGAISKCGREMGLATPLNDLLTHLIKSLEKKVCEG